VSGDCLATAAPHNLPPPLLLLLLLLLPLALPLLLRRLYFDLLISNSTRLAVGRRARPAENLK
jgi:hypothetical protein